MSLRIWYDRRVPTVDSVLEDALRLTDDDKESLIARLAASFEADSDVEALWAVEIERRLQDLRNGGRTYSLDEVKAQMRTNIGWRDDAV